MSKSAALGVNKPWKNAAKLLCPIPFTIKSIVFNSLIREDELCLYLFPQRINHANRVLLFKHLCF